MTNEERAAEERAALEREAEYAWRQTQHPVGHHEAFIDGFIKGVEWKEDRSRSEVLGTPPATLPPPRA